PPTSSEAAPGRTATSRASNARRAARRRNLLHSPRGPNRHRELAAALQHDQAARIARIQAANTGGICPCLRRVAGCATPTGCAGHASAAASLKLTFHLDHSVGANQYSTAISTSLNASHRAKLPKTCILRMQVNRSAHLATVFRT